MIDKNFVVFHGLFPCHTCKEEVKSIRLWTSTAKVTWMCSKKHVSESLLVKTKKDYKKEQHE